MHIRPAVPDDLDALVLLAEAGHEEYRRHLPEVYRAFDRDHWVKRFRQAQKLKDFAIVVAVEKREAESASEICGLIELYIKTTSSPLMQPGRRLVIDNIIVAPAFRRRGIARALLSFAEEYALMHRAERIELEAALTNTAALQLYNSCGYSTRRVILGKTFKS